MFSAVDAVFRNLHLVTKVFPSSGIVEISARWKPSDKRGYYKEKLVSDHFWGLEIIYCTYNNLVLGSNQIIMCFPLHQHKKTKSLVLEVLEKDLAIIIKRQSQKTQMQR